MDSAATNSPKEMRRPLIKLFLALSFVIPWASLIAFGSYINFLKAGSSNDPLGYSVYCEKEVTFG